MSQGKPLGINFIARELIFIGGAGTCLYLVINFIGIAHRYTYQPHEILLNLLMFSLWGTFIVCGILLARLKEVASRLAIVLLLLVLGYVVFHFFSTIQWMSSSIERKQSFSPIYYQFASSSLLPSAILSLLPIFYLSKPRIKQLFK